jgi:hypothetical protein
MRKNTKKLYFCPPFGQRPKFKLKAQSDEKNTAE